MAEQSVIEHKSCPTCGGRGVTLDEDAFSRAYNDHLSYMQTDWGQSSVEPNGNDYYTETCSHCKGTGEVPMSSEEAEARRRQVAAAEAAAERQRQAAERQRQESAEAEAAAERQRQEDERKREQDECRQKLDSVRSIYIRYGTQTELERDAPLLLTVYDLLQQRDEEQRTMRIVVAGLIVSLCIALAMMAILLLKN